MKIPFSLPYIDKSVINEVNDSLINTGWLTSGPKVKELENELQNIIDSKYILCVNSWTSGAQLILRWLGVGPGDEVIIPAYTYSATALCIMNLGAKPIMVDVRNDFTIDPDLVLKKINKKTKAIIPVDIGGLPCDYELINKIVKSIEVKKIFIPKSPIQKKIRRPIVIGDAAHSIGAIYKNKYLGSHTDISIFSFHSVKNLTTGEGGAIALNLPDNFNNEKVFKDLKILGLNGQTKSAFQKNKIGGWRYDIIDQGLKINMPDICAAIGLAQSKIYLTKLLPERKKIFSFYNTFFKKKHWAIIPKSIEKFRESSYHLYLLRIKNIDENKRDLIINYISKKGVGVNVHYIPMPMLTLFKKNKYDIKEFNNTYNLYKNEITLPVYNNLKPNELKIICDVVSEACEKII
tara:strand:+ start:1139 stop:2353 length:1215 start_codon:yes stop_codon:yes gene_type:complete